MPQNYKFCNQTGETPYYHGNSYTITQNSDTITETPDFCLIVRFLPQSPSYQRHPKNQKLGPTTHRDEPHQTSKSLDFKPFFNTFACEYPNSYGIISELPPVSLLDFDDFYPTQFDIRQIDKLSPCLCAESGIE